MISVGGYYLAVWLNGSIAGAMATVAGILFMLAFLFSPTHGVVFRARNQRKAAEKKGLQSA
jgi:manganese/zinc/iron transport system permease protein